MKMFNLLSGIPTWSDTYQSVRPQKMSRSLKLSLRSRGIIMYYLCRENKDADQQHGYHAADLRLCFGICKRQVS